MNKTVTLKEVRNELSELVAKVAYGDQKIVITKFGKPLVALVNYADYEKLIDPASRYTDTEWQKGFDFITSARKNNKKISNKETQKIIEREIAIVRGSKNAKSSS